MTLAHEDTPARVDVVLAGGAGPEFSYQAFNQAFGHLRDGAKLVAMHRNLYWRTDEGLQLDSGSFVVGSALLRICHPCWHNDHECSLPPPGSGCGR